MEANQAERRRWNDAQWVAHWPKRERLTDAVTPFLLEALDLRRGERVLDVGSGGGKAALAAAALVGDHGAVVGADISVPLTELANERAEAAKAGNARFRVVDVQSERADDGPFDVAMSQFGVMFFDEPVTAFANIRTHLRPDGRLGFACWQAIVCNPWFIGAALGGIAPAPPQPEPGKSPTGPFALGDPERVRAILDAAGFVDLSLVNHDLTVEAPDDSVVDDAQLAFIGVPAERMAEARVAVDRHLAQFRQPSGESRFPLAFQIVTAVNRAD